MKKLAIILIVMASSLIAFSQSTTIFPTYPGTEIRDYSKPGMKIEGSNIYQTFSGTTIKDYTYKADTAKIERIKSRVEIDWIFYLLYCKLQIPEILTISRWYKLTTQGRS